MPWFQVRSAWIWATVACNHGQRRFRMRHVQNSTSRGACFSRRVLLVDAWLEHLLELCCPSISICPWKHGSLKKYAYAMLHVMTMSILSPSSFILFLSCSPAAKNSHATWQLPAYYEEIFSLTQLQAIDASGNKLTSVGVSFVQLSALEVPV